MQTQPYYMTLLFDFYGDTLTERQREFYDLYYNEDLSLGEIAENYGISRQGVRDVIVRAEAALKELEEKTGVIRRFHVMQEQIKAVQSDLRLIQARIAGMDNDVDAALERMTITLGRLRQE